MFNESPCNWQRRGPTVLYYMAGGGVQRASASAVAGSKRRPSSARGGTVRDLDARKAEGPRIQRWLKSMS